jgi:hypothetical protein
MNRISRAYRGNNAPAPQGPGGALARLQPLTGLQPRVGRQAAPRPLILTAYGFDLPIGEKI